MRPLWRWWLWCASLDLWFRFGWRWALRLMGWATLPQWVGVANDDPVLEG